MAEEQKWREPGGHTLCANNCGFFGSSTTLDLCSKCYKDHCLKEQQISTAKLVVEQSLIQSESCSISDSSVCLRSNNVQAEIQLSFSTEVEPAASAVAQPNRCANCRRRVGLTGFKCRCGTTFCGSHRLPELHGCTFDFKALGRKEIANANPVVKAEKLEKI